MKKVILLSCFIHASIIVASTYDDATIKLQIQQNSQRMATVLEKIRNKLPQTTNKFTQTTEQSIQNTEPSEFKRLKKRILQLERTLKSRNKQQPCITNIIIASKLASTDQRKLTRYRRFKNRLQK